MIPNKRNYTCLTWDEWYLLAKDYYNTHGNLKIPSKYKTSNGYSLGRWIERQRAAYRQKSGYKIDLRKIYLLNQIEMVWSLESRKRWEIWYRYCEEYYLENGHLDIPRNQIYKQIALGEWISYQRKRFHQGRMNRNQRIQLESLGINWKIRNRRSWDEWYEDAKTYYDVHGNLNVPFEYLTENNDQLGKWINSQREKYRGMRSSTLKDEEFRKLNQLEMLWGKRSSRYKYQVENEMQEIAK